MGTESGGDGSTGSALVPNNLAILVPSFDPSKDDLKIYTQKVQLLTPAWPENRSGELATRLILGCSSQFWQCISEVATESNGTDKEWQKVRASHHRDSWRDVGADRSGA